MRGDGEQWSRGEVTIPQAIFTSYWLRVPEGLLPPGHPKDKGCLSWTLVLP